MRRSPRAALFASALVFVLVAAAPPVSAHALAGPAPTFSRILQDFTDDYYGGGHAQTRPGHELHALDISERYDASLGDVAVLRLWMAGGKLPSELVFPHLVERVNLTVGGSDHRIDFDTIDGATWTGGLGAIKCDRYGAPTAANSDTGNADTGRFYVDCTIRLASFGALPGAIITKAQVQAYDNDVRGDLMVGGFFATSAVTGESYTDGTSGDPTATGNGNFDNTPYAIKTTARLVGAEPSVTRLDLHPGDATSFTLTITNSIVLGSDAGNGDGKAVPTITLDAPGASAKLDAPDLSAMDPGGVRAFKVNVTAGSLAADTILSIGVTTDQGGHRALEIPVHIANPPPPTPTPTPTPTATPTPTPTPTPTATTPVETTPTPLPTATATPVATTPASPTPTATPAASATSTPTATTLAATSATPAGTTPTSTPASTSPEPARSPVPAAALVLAALAAVAVLARRRT